MELFDPTKITTVFSLAAAGVWAICYLKDARMFAQVAAFLLTILGVAVGAYFEWTQHVDPCSEEAELRLNEVCAEGKECSGGYDFVEVYNPTEHEVSLSCYVLVNKKSTRNGERVWSNPHFLPEGEVLGSHETRAWDELELGFNLSRGSDRVRLAKKQLRPGAYLNFVDFDEVGIADGSSYQLKYPDGADSWMPVSHTAVKAAGCVGSFGESNTEDYRCR